MFASRLNYQMMPYVSWHPDPIAWAIDAFALDWSNMFFCAFPPFSVILQVLQKLDGAQTQAILIVPNWPTQSWYPTLTKLLIPRPILLRDSTIPTRKRTSIRNEVEIDGMSLIRQYLSNKGISPKFPSHSSLCVASTLDKYIKRTAPIRGNENELFVSTIKPHNKVIKATISRWIKTVMKTAGINTDIFKPHSTRSASTSKAQICDVPINSILKAASWKRDSVFHRFYNRNIVVDSGHAEFGGATLSAVP